MMDRGLADLSKLMVGVVLGVAILAPKEAGNTMPDSPQSSVLASSASMGSPSIPRGELRSVGEDYLLDPGGC
jgi:hypothetical protein